MGLGFVISKTGLWVDLWGVISIIIFCIAVIYFIVRRRKLIKMEEELEDLLAEKYERESAEEDGQDTDMTAETEEISHEA